MWSIHTMEYHSAFKREETRTPATTWMDLEDMMLSEISQTQKDRYCDSTPVGSLEEPGSQRQKVGGGARGRGIRVERGQSLSWYNCLSEFCESF